MIRPNWLDYFKYYGWLVLALALMLWLSCCCPALLRFLFYLTTA